MIGTKILEERGSKYNGSLRVVKTWGMGTYIQANGLTQSGGVVETIWNQTLKRINSSELIINNCLILGLGGGTVAKLIRKYWPNAKITGVDIDPAMIELGTRYLALGNSKTEIVIGDAFDFCKTNAQSPVPNAYDLIVVDLYQGDKFPEKFTSPVFLKLILRLLSPNGIAVLNRLYQGSNWLSSAYFRDKKVKAEKFGKKLEKIYLKVEKFRPEANLMFICSRRARKKQLRQIELDHF